MGWFSKKKKPAVPPPPKEEIWIQCPSCNAHVYKEEWESSGHVCSHCKHHERLSFQERLDLLLDPGTFSEINSKTICADPLKFADAKSSYADKAQETRKETGLNEAVVTGRGRIGGTKVVIGVMDFRFFGGSLASGTGEKIFLAAMDAVKHKHPFIMVCASGGARMHEGIISLMQMPKTCAAIAHLQQAGLPYLVVLTDPTMGGVSASYAMVGDIHIAEPGATIGFAGRRVIEETIKQKLPDDFQTAEYLLDHGFVDTIVPRKEMKDLLSRVLKYCVAA